MAWKLDSGFYRRFKIYLIGLVMGTILSTILFKTRGCMRWTPNNAVKNRIVYLLKTEPSLKCLLKCNMITTYDIESMVENGKISSFKRTDNGKTKTYILTGKKINTKEYKITYVIKDHGGKVKNIESPQENLPCNCP